MKTQTGMSMGTPKYMSPEQAQGKKVKKTTDIYSLGIILYRLVTGKVPFDAGNFVAIAMMHISEKPASPKYINSDVDVSLSDIILKCLEKDETKRFQSCKKLCEALLNYKENDATQPLRSKLSTDSDTIPLDKGKIKTTPIKVKDEDKKLAVSKKEYKKVLIVVFSILLIILLGYPILRITGTKKKSEPPALETKSENLNETKELKSTELTSSGKSLKALIEDWNKVKYSDNIDEKKDVLKALVNYYPVEADSKNWKYIYGELLLQDGLVNDNKETLLNAKKHLKEVQEDFKGTGEYDKIKQLIEKVDNTVANKSSESNE